MVVRLILAFIAFISLGMPDMLLGVAWPSMRGVFGVELSAAGWLVLAGTLGYTMSALAAVAIMRRLNLGMLLTLSATLTGLGLLAFLLTPWFGWMVLIGLATGFGGGAIDVALNQYVMDNHSERLMQWLHASFGAGVTVGPVLVALALASDSGWRLAYGAVGAAMMLLAALFLLTRRVWPALSIQSPNHVPSGWRESLKTPAVVIQILMFMIYTGCELGVGVWAFVLMTEGRDVSIVTAGFWVSAYWGGFTLARVLMGTWAHHLDHWRLLSLSLLTSVVAVVLWAWNPTVIVGLVALALLGAGFGPIYPGLMSATRARVGAHHAARTVSLQVGLAVIGAGLLAGLIGWVAEQLGVTSIPLTVGALIGLLVLLEWMQRRGARAQAVHL